MALLPLASSVNPPPDPTPSHLQVGPLAVIVQIFDDPASINATPDIATGLLGTTGHRTSLSLRPAASV